MTENVHELAPHHLPFFIPTADGGDQLMATVLIFLIVIVLLLGTFYLYLHSLPERLAHKHGRIQFELVAVLGLLALFTHNQIFWVAALVLAFIELPDFMSPLDSIANSTRKIAGRYGAGRAANSAPSSVEPGPESVAESETAAASDQDAGNSEPSPGPEPADGPVSEREGK